MNATDSDTDTEAPTLNGYALTSIENAEKALRHLGRAYNDGNITKLTNGGLRLLSRRQRFQHFHTLNDADALRFNDVRAVTVDGEARMEIELVEVDR